MPLFGKWDEAGKLFKEANKCIDISSDEFDLDKGIHLLEEAVVLKPSEKKYYERLEEAKVLRSKFHEQFILTHLMCYWKNHINLRKSGFYYLF